MLFCSVLFYRSEHPHNVQAARSANSCFCDDSRCMTDFRATCDGLMVFKLTFLLTPSDFGIWARLSANTWESARPLLFDVNGLLCSFCGTTRKMKKNKKPNRGFIHVFYDTFMQSCPSKGQGLGRSRHWPARKFAHPPPRHPSCLVKVARRANKKRRAWHCS